MLELRVRSRRSNCSTPTPTSALSFGRYRLQSPQQFNAPASRRALTFKLDPGRRPRLTFIRHDDPLCPPQPRLAPTGPSRPRRALRRTWRRDIELERAHRRSEEIYRVAGTWSREGGSSVPTLRIGRATSSAIRAVVIARSTRMASCSSSSSTASRVTAPCRTAGRNPGRTRRHRGGPRGGSPARAGRGTGYRAGRMERLAGYYSARAS